MSSSQEQFPQLEKLSREGMLLLYIAGELSDTDRARVEQLITADAALAAELQSLGEVQAAWRDGLSLLDRQEHSERADARQSNAMRDVTRMMRQWTLQGRHIASIAPQGRRVPWLRYGMAVAASLLIGYLGWTAYLSVGGRHEPAPGGDNVIASVDKNGENNSADAAAQDQLALLSDTFSMSAASDSSNVRLAAVSQNSELEFFSNVP